jgi:hypothetical protein
MCGVNAKCVHRQPEELELYIGMLSSLNYNELPSIIMDTSEQGVQKSLVTRMTKFCTVASNIFTIIFQFFPFLYLKHTVN